MKIIYRGFCIGTVSKSDAAKYAKWDKILDRRQKDARRRKGVEKKKEIVNAWVGEAGKWMGRKMRAAATRVKWQDCRCGSRRYGVRGERKRVYVRCSVDGCRNVWCVKNSGKRCLKCSPSNR